MLRLAPSNPVSLLLLVTALFTFLIQSGELGTSASKLLDAANGLSSQSERLKLEVDSFLGSVRAV